jgi:hypothetical protein
MEERNPNVKEKINEVVDSMLHFANCILGEDTSGNRYTMSEIELANHIRIAIIFYRAREDSTPFNEAVTTEPKQKPDEV